MKQDLTVGGMATRFGVGMISPEKICVAVRLADDEISTFCNKIFLAPSSKIFSLPFLRVVLLFRQVYFISRLFTLNLRPLSISGMVVDEGNKVKIVTKFILLYLATSILYYYLMLFVDYLGVYRFILEKIVFIFMSLFFVVIFVRVVMGKQVLRYHGAEHKAINLYNSGEKLSVKNAGKKSRIALRCGTTVVWFVIILETILSSFVIVSLPWWALLPVTILMFVVLLSFAYELSKFLIRFENKLWAKIIYYPALWFQAFTTAEPTEKELEVALAAIDSLII